MRAYLIRHCLLLRLRSLSTWWRGASSLPLWLLLLIASVCGVPSNAGLLLKYYIRELIICVPIAISACTSSQPATTTGVPIQILFFLGLWLEQIINHFDIVIFLVQNLIIELVLICLSQKVITHKSPFITWVHQECVSAYRGPPLRDQIRDLHILYLVLIIIVLMFESSLLRNFFHSRLALRNQQFELG